MALDGTSTFQISSRLTNAAIYPLGVCYTLLDSKTTLGHTKFISLGHTKLDTLILETICDS